MSVSRHPLTPTTDGLSRVPLDRGVVALLGSSFQVIKDKGGEFADRFYGRFFAAYPALRAMFPADMTAQKGKLLDTLAAVVAHLTDPQSNLARLQELGRRHVGYGAKPEHFPLVVSAMIAAMGEVSGDDWNQAIEAEWRRALQLVSQVMIDAAGTAPKPAPPAPGTPGRK